MEGGNVKSISKRGGQISIPLSIVISITISAITGTAAYFGSIIDSKQALADVVADVKTDNNEIKNIRDGLNEVKNEVSSLRSEVKDDNQRITDKMEQILVKIK